MKNILRMLRGHTDAVEEGSMRDLMTTQELVAQIVSRTHVNVASKEEANKLLVGMDFDEVERKIFGVKDLSNAPADVLGHSSVVPSGYPFMDKVKSLVEHRLKLKGIHSLR